jgi:hypothetical protein
VNRFAAGQPSPSGIDVGGSATRGIQLTHVQRHRGTTGENGVLHIKFLLFD